MNQLLRHKGEATLFGVLSIVIISGLLLITTLELKRSFTLLQKRTQLFLCVKETQIILKDYLIFMGRTNWGLQNIMKLALVMVFIPGLQAVAVNLPRAKEFLKLAQNLYLIAYLKSLNDLRGKGCPIDPRLVITPFEFGTGIYRRNIDDSAKLRRREWSYQFLSSPYLLSMNIKALDLNAIRPVIKFQTTEKAARLSSIMSSSF